MKSSVEPVEGNKVKLSIQVDGAEFEHEVDDAFKRIAREVRIPGFRPGKAPRALLEARIGSEAARGDALEHAVPKYYAEALAEHEVDVIASPAIDITAGREEGDVAFDAVVEVRPVVTVGGYASLRITLDSPTVTDEELDERITGLRRSHATLEPVDRPVLTGDYVTVDIVGSQDGEDIPQLTASDYLYQVGSNTIVPEFDEHLTGAKAADVVEFDADHPDPDEDQVHFQVTVKEVKEQVLPEADDAWAAEASEFETIAELRADLAERLGSVKKIQTRMQIQEKTAEALTELVELEIPDAMINDELGVRIEDLGRRLAGQGVTIEQYLASRGQDQETFLAELRVTAEQGAKLDLALRAVVLAEGFEIDEADYDAEVELISARSGMKANQVRKQLERNGQVPAVRSDLRKRKALEWLTEQVELVDGSGKTIERADLEVEPTPTADAAAEPGDDPVSTEDSE